MNRSLLIFTLLATSLFLTSCVSVDISQKIYRDGSSDISMEVTAPEMLRETVKNQLYLDGATITETEDGFKIQVDKFVPKGNETGIFSTYGFKRESKFPNYIYTITIPSEGMEDSGEARL